MKRGVGYLALAIVTLVGAGCGSSQPAGPSPSTAAEDLLLYRCSGEPFDPAALEGPGNLEDEDSPLGEALRRLFESSEGEMLSAAEGWRVVQETADEVQVMAPRNDEWFVSATFTKEGDRYITGGFGDCRPTAVLGRRSPMTWELASDVNPVSNTVEVLATEIECASARSPAPEQIDAHATYSEAEVSVLVYVDEIVGGDCPGNPAVPFTIELSEPIGDRALLDTARYPPREQHR